ncbi:MULTISPECIES: acyltransferase family protein [unclassified Rhizobium]|uniref:acyltransferase family protein n=1 Tax=unclassified Rhizobium TaxID=2613769 RepID=UPI00160E770C|nr:fucose 4-O-acetylase-like acetyltransferase [Rhizobium sp. BK098]MBB3617267.1 fucose 4-O-acetylase-like acetyltransferase [Rhizobium sp. BK609]MBB3682897.1 fucose 4-O-acetylase-like acetyltransferase [Rhizobium sp. BK612]
MQRDEAIDILRGLGIIAVVAGHVGTDIGIKILPVYSYHMPLFFFISGIFYRDDKIESIFQITAKLFSRMIFPALAAAIFYDFVTLSVFHQLGLPFGGGAPNPSAILRTFLFGGYLTAAYWFIGAYILIYLYFHIIHVWTHSIASRLIGPAITRSVCGVLYVGAAAASIYVATLLYGDVQDQDRHIIVAGHKVEIVLLRFLLGCGFYYLGSLFGRFQDRLPSSPALPLAVAAICFVIEGFIFRNYNVFFSMQIMSFPNFVTPMITSIFGIIIFYAISEALTRSRAARILSFIGQNSYAILLNHMFGFFLLNLLFVALGRISLSDISDPYYRFQQDETVPLYILFGLVVSIAIPILLKEALHGLKVSISKIA